jgi:hypothetical protein
MKSLKMFNSLVALRSLEGIVLKNVSVKRVSLGFNGGAKTVYTGCTRQAIKLAMAIADTSYPVMYDAIQHIPEFKQSGRDYAEFHALVSSDSVEEKDPLHSAELLLGRV